MSEHDTHTISVAVRGVIVTRINGRDKVAFVMATPLGFVDMSDAHSPDLVIDTMFGNGPRVARDMGWPGEILVVGPSALRKRVDRGDYDCIEREVDLAFARNALDYLRK